MSIPDTLPEDWKKALDAEFQTDRMTALSAFLKQELAAGKTIYPAPAQIFNALESTPLDKTKVVIIGQDPYHGPGQAHGLCFSVQKGVRVPPSLQNIFQEMKDDLGLEAPDHGCLEDWTRQGVLLLNSSLTVERGQAGSHAGKGWEEFTDAVIRAVNNKQDGVVFILWGRHAQAKADFVDETKHLVIKSPHPSPFAARKGFFGSKPFSRANQWLERKGRAPVDWRIA